MYHKKKIHHTYKIKYNDAFVTKITKSSNNDNHLGLRHFGEFLFYSPFLVNSPHLLETHIIWNPLNSPHLKNLILNNQKLTFFSPVLPERKKLYGIALNMLKYCWNRRGQEFLKGKNTELTQQQNIKSLSKFFANYFEGTKGNQPSLYFILQRI